MNGLRIHRDNYEEFFLLYIDGELTAPEMASVEHFVEQHPELKPELQRLMETRLNPEPVSFEGKESLLRPAGCVGPENIEELQVQWLDDELDAATAADVEAYTLAHPQAAAGLEALKKTKLPPEHIVFPDKASLYRYDQKPVPRLPLYMKRMAAAAALLLAVALFWMNREDAEPMPGIPVSAGVSTPAPSEKDMEPRQIAEEKIAARNQANAPASGEGRKAGSRPAGEIFPDHAVTITTRDRIDNATADLPEPKTDAPVNEVAITEAPPAPVLPVLPVSEGNEGREAPALNVKNDYASEALAGGEDRKDQGYAFDESRQRKGLRGIVRKVNRFYNKATNPDPNRTMVKVASFEIGLPR
jgi:anti-sigma factor RsiW